MAVTIARLPFRPSSLTSHVVAAVEGRSGLGRSRPSTRRIRSPRFNENCPLSGDPESHERSNVVGARQEFLESTRGEYVLQMGPTW